jgi:hypothetical protein
MSKNEINKQEQEVLYTQLNLLGANEVVVEFSGAGDSGQIDSVYYLDKNNEPQDIPNDMIAWTKQTYGSQEPTTERTLLQDVIEDLCYRALDGTGLDWYNNEGGQGRLIIDFKVNPPKTILHVGINEMITEDHEFDLDEENE